MKEFVVTATWIMEGQTLVYADSLEEAQEMAEELNSFDFQHEEELSDSLEVLDVEEVI